VHPALEQSVHLPAEEIARFLSGCRPEGLDPDPQRAYRSGHHDVLARGLQRERGGGAVDLFGVVTEPICGQLHRVGPERIGLENLRARLDVLLVDAPDDVRALPVEFVVAHVHEDAATVEERAHRPVEDVDAPVLDEGLHPSSPGSYPRLGASHCAASFTLQPFRSA
jgi:hypothetical protein